MTPRIVAALVAAAVLGCSCRYDCLALCVPIASLAFVDEQGLGVAPGAGAIFFEGATTSFDCAPGAVAPARVRCDTNAMTLDALNQHASRG